MDGFDYRKNYKPVKPILIFPAVADRTLCSRLLTAQGTGKIRVRANPLTQSATCNAPIGGQRALLPRNRQSGLVGGPRAFDPEEAEINLDVVEEAGIVRLPAPDEEQHAVAECSLFTAADRAATGRWMSPVAPPSRYGYHCAGKVKRF